MVPMTGLVSGAFDMLHYGHVEFLRSAKLTCDQLIVCVNSDASVRRAKGPQRPVFSQVERIAIVGALRSVDAVIGFDSETDLERICEEFAPHLLRIVGSDYRGKNVIGAHLAHVIYLDRGHYSTSQIIERIHACNLTD